MSGKTWRRIGFCAALAAALAADACFSYRLAWRRFNAARPAVSSAVAAEESDPLTRFRTEREQLRARQSAQLNDIIYNAATDAETVAQAQRQLLDMLSAQAHEVTLEGILQSRGFGDALVSVQGDSVNVLLRREAVTQRESAVILELVLRETGVTGGNVKIIPVN